MTGVREVVLSLAIQGDLMALGSAASVPEGNADIKRSRNWILQERGFKLGSRPPHLQTRSQTHGRELVSR